MANFWVLWNMVMVNSQKMSKSLGNFTTIKDALKKYDAAVIRLWVLSSHYRSPINFSESSLEQAKRNLNRITDWIYKLDKSKKTEIEGKINFEKFKKEFEEAMDDDLNTPLALSVLYELMTETNKLISEEKLSSAEAKKILAFWGKINQVFGLVISGEETEVSEKIKKLAEERRTARQNKDFKKSDELREQIEKSGYIVEDLKDNNYNITQKNG
jgi:cysteinyl-tRNA synthetase